MDKAALLKTFIKGIHQGEDPEAIKEEFKEAFKDASSADVAAAEEQLVNEGMSLEEVHKLCAVHLAALRDIVEQKGDIAPQGHPIHTLMAEHARLLDFARDLLKKAGGLKARADFEAAGEDMKAVDHLTQHFKEAELHYLREENALFPYLEKHGVTQPPKVMWMEHDNIRALKKKIYSLVESARDLGIKDFASQLEDQARALSETLSNHFYKENNVLFPTALKVIEEGEWAEVSRQFDDIGYCCFSPQVAKAADEEAAWLPASGEGQISFETGILSSRILEAMLNTLPVEITFVDHEDTVRYFSQPKDKIFTRTKAVIGLKVQNCHPRKSIHLVNQILEDFKSGKRDVAEFWIDINGKKIYIRYFAVRNKNGDYLGCMEVTQDITEVQKIKGQKRLLD